MGFLTRLAEVALLVAGLQHAAILHHHADPARKVELAQKPLHGGRQDLGGTHLRRNSPKLVSSLSDCRSLSIVYFLIGRS